MNKYSFPGNRHLAAEAKLYLSGQAESYQAVLEIGDGILAVRTKEQYDIYFDTGRWRLKIEIKQQFKEIIFPEGLLHIGVLPGRFFKGGVGTYSKIMAVVGKQLERTAPHYKLLHESASAYDHAWDDQLFKDIGDFMKMFRG